MRAVLIALLVASRALCADWSSIYPAEQLEDQRGRLTSDVNLVVAQEIQPFLTESQGLAFSNLTIDLPATAEPAANPFDFYSARQGHITLPLFTVAMIEDLAKAYSWLWANRFSSETVDEYLGMLAHRRPEDFQAKRYPSPLEALHIPPDAMNNPSVAKMAPRVRGTTLSFILLHEFGHLSYRTAAQEAALKHDRQASEEEQADLFALEVMKKNSETPAGLLMLIHGMLYLPSAPPKDHPLSVQRLGAMSDYLYLHLREFVEGRPDRSLAAAAIESLAQHIRRSATFLADTKGQELWAEQSSQTTVAKLVPRRPGTPP